MSTEDVVGDTQIQCPACDWIGKMEDFDLVLTSSSVQVHCPSCDANLGSPTQALKRAA
jgi:ribosomal protein S27E